MTTRVQMEMRTANGQRETGMERQRKATQVSKATMMCKGGVLGVRVGVPRCFLCVGVSPGLQVLSPVTPQDGVDVRDGRPLNIAGRILIPTIAKDKLVDYPWRACPLLRKSRTEEAELVRTQDMILVEDLDPETLPSTSAGTAPDLTSHRHSQVRGAPPFVADGPEALAKLDSESMRTQRSPSELSSP